MQITGFSSVTSSYATSRQNLTAEAQDKQGQERAPENVSAKSLEAEQQKEVQALKDRDREVRAHEQAHLSAAGGIAVSGAKFKFVTGPDGQRYAVGGEVGIDTSAVPGDPEATLRKAETIRRAAMAPAQPSGQDYSIASKAAAMANRARLELLKATQATDSSGSQLSVTA